MWMGEGVLLPLCNVNLKSGVFFNASGQGYPPAPHLPLLAPFSVQMLLVLLEPRHQRVCSASRFVLHVLELCYLCV